MKKLKQIALVLVFFGVSFLSIAAKNSAVDDQLEVFNSKTIQLLESRNDAFQRHHEKIKIILRSRKVATSIEPKRNEMIIFVTQKDKRKNVEISLGKNLKKIISTPESINFIQATKTQLRSSNKSTFNSGIQKIINTSASLIDKYYHVKNKNDLSEKELKNLNHPQSVKVIWGVGIGIFTIAALAWWQNFKIKH